LRYLRDMLADALAGRRDGEQGGVRKGSRVLQLLAMAGCVESLVALTPLKVTTASGVLGAVPALLAEESEDDVVQVAAVNVVMAVVARKDGMQLGTPECEMVWAIMGQVLEATAVLASRPSPRHLALTKRLATVSTDFGVAHLAALSAARGGQLSGLARLLAHVCAFPALSVVSATLPFWGACVERQRNLPAASEHARVTGHEGGREGGEEGLEEGIQAQMLMAMMNRLGQGGMSPLDEEEFVDELEYRQAVMNVRCVCVCVCVCERERVCVC
jgi:hypothetical protein